jgi:hypothetical protein
VKDYTLQIEAYLQGELNEQDLSAFEQALKTDPELGRAVVQYNDLHQRFVGMLLRKKVGTALQGKQAAKPRSTWRWIWSGIAGAGILVLFFGLFSDKSATSSQPNPPANPPEINKKAPENPPPAPVTVPGQSIQPKGTSRPLLPVTGHPIAFAQEFYVSPTGRLIREANEQATEKTALQQADDAFADQQYHLSATLLRDEALIGDDESARFLRANARFKDGQFSAAGKDFQQLENSFKYKYEARWNLLLCEIAQGNAHKPAVRSVLKEMIADTDFPFQEAAVRLKTRLEY